MAKEDQLIAEWRQNVLSELKYCRENIDTLKEEISELKVDVNSVKNAVANTTNQVNTHFTGCPMNRENVEKIIDTKLELFEGKQPEKSRKVWVDFATIIAVILALLSMMIQFM